MKKIVLNCISALMLMSAGAMAETNNLDYSLSEGNNLNLFCRDGSVAAHVVLRSGADPRLIVVFPAGNSGVALWFDRLSPSVQWKVKGGPHPEVLHDALGRPLYGVSFVTETDVPVMQFKQAALSSVRILRDYQDGSPIPAMLEAKPSITGDTITWQRDRLDGTAGYRLSLKVTEGRLDANGLAAGSSGRIVVRVIAASGETPLHALPNGVLRPDLTYVDTAARDTLAFLSYREKFLAGSWRFNTYFGRDTLMSVNLLMPALQPEAVETGLRSVLTRLSPDGEVAHEEDIGEYAIFEHMQRGEGKSAAPIYDYKMIDSDFMLAPVARAWLLDDPRGRARAAAFLSTPFDNGRLGDALLRNLRFVAARAQAFAAEPVFEHLISLKKNESVGQWRDSNDGLGGGRYPYDVNAVFVPAALDAAVALFRSGLLDPYCDAADRKMMTVLDGISSTWKTRAPQLFEVSVPAETARSRIAGYAAMLRVPDGAALAAVGDKPMRFYALSLNADGSPVEIEHSDIGFSLLFGDPSPAALTEIVKTISRPFPAGLMTDAGMLISNPVFAPSSLQMKFGKNAYHGTVVWSWQQAVVAAGMARQLRRSDLPVEIRQQLTEAQSRLWTVIGAAKQIRNSELWTWNFADGRTQIMPFGAGQADVTESNAAQLWSTVFLAMFPSQAD